MTSHRASKTAIYRVWQQMRCRCSRERNHNYQYYGGRGIRVCDRWQNSFENFIADMGPRPSEKHKLDRIYNDGDYAPGNCRWVTHSENMKNTRASRLIAHNGVTKGLAEWSLETGLLKDTIRRRLDVGWPVEKALTTPAEMKFWKARKIRTGKKESAK